MREDVLKETLTRHCSIALAEEDQRLLLQTFVASTDSHALNYRELFEALSLLDKPKTQQWRTSLFAICFAMLKAIIRSYDLVVQKIPPLMAQRLSLSCGDCNYRT